jgi:hypothetical protein
MRMLEAWELQRIVVAVSAAFATVAIIAAALTGM